MQNKKIVSVIIALLMTITNISFSSAASYEYDVLGRLTKVIYDDTQDKFAEYSYDEGGNIKKVTGFERVKTVSSYVWNYTDGTNTNDFYTVSGNAWNNAATISYNGVSLTKAIKMESKTSISFTAPSAGTLKLVTYSDNASPTILINNVETSVAISGETEVEISSADIYNIVKGTTNTYVYYMEFIPEGTIISTETESTTETTTEYIDHSLNYTWDFDRDIFKTLGIISETKTVDELTFNASADKTMEVELNTKQFNGVSHEYALNTGGAGNKTSHSVSFAAKQNTDIYITAKSTNSTPINLTVANAGGVVGSVSIDDAINSYRFSYTGTDDTLYVYGANGAIQIYSISLRTYSDEAEDIDTTWNFSSTEFSGISTVTDVQEVSGLSVYADSEIVSDTYKLNETTYTKALNLSGRGTNDSKSVSFNVGKNADIYVTAKSNNETRTLILVNEFGSVVDSVTLTTTPTTYHMNYTGSGDKLYLRSQNGGIKIYDISVKTENNAQPLNKTWRFDDCVLNDVLDDNVEGLSFTGAISLMTDAAANSEKLYAQSLALTATGTTANNNIKLTVPADTTLKITISSSDSTNRQVLITNQYGYVLGNVTAANIPTEFSMTTTCDDEIVCIRSLNGCVYVQEITVGTGSGVEDGIVEQRYDVSSNAVSTETINNLMLDNYSCDYKNQLSETEKSIYELFVQNFASDSHAVGEFTKIIYDNDDVAYNNINAENLRKTVRNAFSAFINDYPEIFWVDTLALNLKSDGSNILTTDIWVIRNRNFTDDAAVNSAISQLNSILNTVETVYNNGTFRFTNRSADGYDKAKLLYLYVLDNTDYSYNTSNENSHNAYGALVLNIAESDGIARAFKLLCKRCEIPCIYASGKINSSTSNAYAWNYVKVFGKWFMCDITTDIVDENTTPEYAMVSADSQYIKGNPSIYKNCDGITYAYPSVEDYDCFIWGDANLNGELDSNDAEFAMSMVLNASFTTAPRNLINADVTADGQIVSDDSSWILQKYIDPSWDPGDPLDENLRDMFGVTGVAVYNERMAEFDKNNDGIVNVDDWVIAVNDVMSANSAMAANADTEISSNSISLYSVHETAVTRQMILDLFE